MWLFWLYLALGFIAVLGLIGVYCYFRKQGFFSFIWQYFKWVVLAVVIVWLIITIMCWHHLYSATQCYFRGVSMKSDTKYSIYLGECQIKTSKGAYVPIDRTRALPDGGNANEIADEDGYYGY